MTITLLHGDKMYFLRGESVVKLLCRYKTTSDVLEALGLSIDTITIPAGMANRVISLWWFMEGSSAISFSRSYFGRQAILMVEKAGEGQVRITGEGVRTSTILGVHGIVRRMGEHHSDENMAFTFYY